MSSKGFGFKDLWVKRDCWKPSVLPSAERRHPHQEWNQPEWVEVLRREISEPIQAKAI